MHMSVVDHLNRHFDLPFLMILLTMRVFQRRHHEIHF
jgi:hypothetical protein